MLLSQGGGAASDVVLRTGLAMTVVQFGIGALNDVVDAPRDAGRKPGKPIPAGAVNRRSAEVLVVGDVACGRDDVQRPVGRPGTRQRARCRAGGVERFEQQR